MTMGGAVIILNVFSLYRPAPRHMSYGPNQSLYEGTYHGDADDFSQFQPVHRR